MLINFQLTLDCRDHLSGMALLRLTDVVVTLVNSVQFSVLKDFICVCVRPLVLAICVLNPRVIRQTKEHNILAAAPFRKQNTRKGIGY